MEEKNENIVVENTVDVATNQVENNVNETTNPVEDTKTQVSTPTGPLYANSSMVLQGKCYRFTVLTERLIRLEYHPQGVFNDLETELVKFRNFPKPDFQAQEDGRYLVIKTKYFTLSYSKEKPLDGGKLMPTANLKIDLVGTERTWYYNHPEVKNYKAQFIALDGSEQDSKAQNGLYSMDGFATIDDSNSLLYDSGNHLLRRDGKGIDLYLFMYNNDFKLALNDYYTLTGYPAMIPRYALGNWWSRDLYYNSTELEEVIAHFEKNEIPLSVLLLDKGWHVDKTEDGKEIKTGYSVNKELIPDFNSLVAAAKEKKIHVGLEINPIDGVYPHEDHYPEIANIFNITENKIIAFDPLNPTLLDAIYNTMLSPLKNSGVDFFWNNTSSQDLDAKKLFLLNSFLYNKQSLDNKHSMLLARNGLVASHRYPVTYTGKTVVGWDMLKKVVKITQDSSNIGLTWVSNDVSGNYGGVEEEELYIRAVEQATFGPILRFSSPMGRYYRKEPWRWNANTLEIVTRFLKLRHRLIPYLYSKAYDYHKGELMINPLYYAYPWVYDDSNYKYEYYLGEMLVAPILTKKDSLINRTIQRFYIPDGIWYDFITGKKFPGNKQYISFYRDEDYPIFVKRGAIIPLNDDEENINSTDNPKNLEIHIFPGDSNTFNLYEDKDDNEQNHLITQFDYNYLPNNYTLIIRTMEGNRGVVDDYRNYKVRFRNTKKAENVICYFNDSQIKTVSYVDEGDFVVEIENVPSIGQVTLNCKGKDIEIDAMRFINDDIDSILLDLPINTVLKEQISQIMFSNLPIKRKRIEIRKLSKFNLGREYIKLFLKLLEYIQTI